MKKGGLTSLTAIMEHEVLGKRFGNIPAGSIGDFIDRIHRGAGTLREVGNTANNDLKSHIDDIKKKDVMPQLSPKERLEASFTLICHRSYIAAIVRLIDRKVVQNQDIPARRLKISKDSIYDGEAIWRPSFLDSPSNEKLSIPIFEVYASHIEDHPLFAFKGGPPIEEVISEIDWEARYFLKNFIKEKGILSNWSSIISESSPPVAEAEGKKPPPDEEASLDQPG